MRYLEGRRRTENDRLIDVCFAAKSADAMIHAAKITGCIVGINELLELTFSDMQMKEVM